MLGDFYHFPINMKPLRWKRHMLFTGVRNDTLFEATAGGFPVTGGGNSQETHPIFVLELRKSGPQVCPCSTKNWYDRADRRYLRAGAVTSNKKIIKHDTYLADEHPFTVPRGMEYAEEFEEKYTNKNDPGEKPLYCMGVVRDEDIIRGAGDVR